jgi:hypothetical protein
MHEERPVNSNEMAKLGQCLKHRRKCTYSNAAAVYVHMFRWHVSISETFITGGTTQQKELL